MVVYLTWSVPDCYLGDSGVKKKQTGSMMEEGMARAMAYVFQSWNRYPQNEIDAIPVTYEYNSLSEGVRLYQQKGKDWHYV